MKKNIADVYWIDQGFYLAIESHVRYNSKASMWRRAHQLGFTHTRIIHGYYLEGQGFVDIDIPEHVEPLPKCYRISGSRRKSDNDYCNSKLNEPVGKETVNGPNKTI